MKTTPCCIGIAAITFFLGLALGLNTSNIGLDSPYLKEVVANNFHNFIDLAKAVLWPLAVVIVIWMFQDDVKSVVGLLSKRATKIEGFGMTIALRGSDSSSDLPPLNVNKEMIANIYWLGADIMFTVGCLQENLGNRFVLHGLKQSIHHAEAVFTTDNIVAEKLRSRYQEVRQANGQLSIDFSQRIAEDLVGLRNQIGSSIEITQANYDNGLEGNSHLSVADRQHRLKQ